MGIPNHMSSKGGLLKGLPNPCSGPGFHQLLPHVWHPGHAHTGVKNAVHGACHVPLDWHMHMPYPPMLRLGSHLLYHWLQIGLLDSACLVLCVLFGVGAKQRRTTSWGCTRLVGLPEITLFSLCYKTFRPNQSNLPQSRLQAAHKCPVLGGLVPSPLHRVGRVHLTLDMTTPPQGPGPKIGRHPQLNLRLRCNHLGLTPMVMFPPFLIPNPFSR